MTMYFAVVDVECNEPVGLYHTYDDANFDMMEAGYNDDVRYEIMPMDSEAITAHRLEVISVHKPYPCKGDHILEQIEELEASQL